MHDPNKLKAFSNPGVFTEPMMPSMAEPMVTVPLSELNGDAKLDDVTNLSPEAMQHRLSEPQIGYLESTEKGGAFSCGNCRYDMEGFCAQPCVMAKINEKNGCCNHFTPDDPASLIEPEKWACMESEEEDEPEAKDGEDDEEDGAADDEEDGEDEE